jgi:hypothetical protein
VFVLIKNAQVLLDGNFMKNVVIQDSRIVYRGGPMELENVYFVNCTFDVIDDTRGQQFAKAMFCPNPATTLEAT